MLWRTRGMSRVSLGIEIERIVSSAWNRCIYGAGHRSGRRTGPSSARQDASSGSERSTTDSDDLRLSVVYFVDADDYGKKSVELNARPDRSSQTLLTPANGTMVEVSVGRFEDGADGTVWEAVRYRGRSGWMDILDPEEMYFDGESLRSAMYVDLAWAGHAGIRARTRSSLDSRVVEELPDGSLRHLLAWDDSDESWWDNDVATSGVRLQGDVCPGARSDTGSG